MEEGLGEFAGYGLDTKASLNPVRGCPSIQWLVDVCLPNVLDKVDGPGSILRVCMPGSPCARGGLEDFIACSSGGR